MSEVIWSPRSTRALARIFRYIARDNPHDAVRVGRRIVDAGNALGQYLTGRPGRYARRYEKSLTVISYILHYRIRRGSDDVVILDIVYSRREWQPGKQPPA